jgi:hypothetical protein
VEQHVIRTPTLCVNQNGRADRQVVVGQHRPFGATRGPRGIENGGQIVTLAWTDIATASFQEIGQQ